MPKKKKNEAELLAALLGIEAPTRYIGPTESSEEISRQAEAALAYASNASAFISKTCKSCGQVFAHTRGAVAYCSDTCRAVGLKKLGIRWDWSKPPGDRWGKDEPLVVLPEALELLTPTAPDEPVEEPAPETDSVLDLLAELGLE